MAQVVERWRQLRPAPVWLRTAWNVSVDDADEKRLLGAARTGDTAALERLLARHEPGLRALCRGVLNHAEDAEDAIQETFLRALRALPAFREQAGLRTWLFRIALNVCLENRRGRAARPATVSLDHAAPAAVSLECVKKVMPSVSPSVQSWQVESRLRWSADSARSLCSGDDTCPAKQRYALPPSAS